MLRTRHRIIMLLAVFLAALPAQLLADSFTNAPTLKPPPEALRKCIDGEVLVKFRIVAGHPEDMEILSSEPDNLYTDAFIEWWSEFDEWRRAIGQQWGEDTEPGTFSEQRFKFLQCADL